MTPVELLREAARLMRERAEAATPGPWRGDYVGDYLCVTAQNWDVAACYAGPWDGTVTDKQRKARANREHIASWHPAVALAVADWLDVEAYAIEHGLTWRDRALAVARAYLGGQS